MDEITTPLIRAIEATWSAVQKRHPDVPDVIVTLAGSTDRLGHFCDGIWQHQDGRMAELFIAGEGLQHGPRELLSTILHEAAHGIANTRGIRDTSSQGRYHNKRFRAVAEETGLSVERHPSKGWAVTSLPDRTAQAYAAHTEILGEALKAYRVSHRPHRKDTNNGIAVSCPCGRKIRMAESVWRQAPVICGACGGEFA